MKISRLAFELLFFNFVEYLWYIPKYCVILHPRKKELLNKRLL